MSGKSLPPPAGGQDLTALLRSRHVQPEAAVPPEKPVSPPVLAEALNRLHRPQPASKRVTTEMDRRSWYMPRASADALAEAVESLHWETRQPKHAVLAALIEAALQQRDQVARKLSH